MSVVDRLRSEYFSLLREIRDTEDYLVNYYRGRIISSLPEIEAKVDPIVNRVEKFIKTITLLEEILIAQEQNDYYINNLVTVHEPENLSQFLHEYYLQPLEPTDLSLPPPKLKMMVGSVNNVTIKIQRE